MKEEFDVNLGDEQSIEEMFDQGGVELYVDKKSEKLKLSPLAQGVLRKSVVALGPVVESIVKLNAVHRALTEKLTEGSDAIVHDSIAKSFLSGIVYYLIMIFPTVLILAVMFRLYNHARTLSLSHYVMFLATYFSFSSGMLFVLSYRADGDVLVDFRITMEGVFVLYMFVNCSLFFVLAGLILIDVLSRRCRNLNALVELGLLTFVGVQMFFHVLERTMEDDEPDLNYHYFILYFAGFLLVLLDRRFMILRSQNVDAGWIATCRHFVSALRKKSEK
mmetsp:Transcript_14811/g.37782  ORF Transcript_14811/g.37782 Transcript_14811/m.37782 type:complete len:276 (+) Transcript_14811:140-967(+)